MQKERKDKHFIKKPIYPGGLKAMRDLIRKELKYPVEALEAKTEGIVYLRYNIDYKGKVTSSKILKGIGFGCDEEAQRIVSKFIFEVPKGPKKLRIKFHKTIKIHFRLPREVSKKVIDKIVSVPNLDQRKTKIHYSITPSVKKASETKTKQKGYTYTIKF